MLELARVAQSVPRMPAVFRWMARPRGGHDALATAQAPTPNPFLFRILMRGEVSDLAFGLLDPGTNGGLDDTDLVRGRPAEPGR